MIDFTGIGIIVGIVGVVIVGIIFGMKHFSIWPFREREEFKFGMVNETRDLSWHIRPITDLKRIGTSKNLSFVYKDGRYIVKNDSIVRNSKKATLLYQEGNPMPFKLRFNSDLTEEQPSASETQEMAESKVVFDLLRFTLSKVETTALIAIVACLAISAISAYFSYQTNTQVGTQDALLRQIVHYLFPTSALGQ